MDFKQLFKQKLIEGINSEYELKQKAIQTSKHISFFHNGNETDLKVGQSVYRYGNNNKHTEFIIVGFKKPSKAQMGKFGDTSHDYAKHTIVKIEREVFGKTVKQSVKAFKLDSNASAPDYFTVNHNTYGFMIK